MDRRREFAELMLQSDKLVVEGLRHGAQLFTGLLPGAQEADCVGAA
jgi:hypothetical protein